jgi:hypothetical protein
MAKLLLDAQGCAFARSFAARQWVVVSSLRGIKACCLRLCLRKWQRTVLAMSQEQPEIDVRGVASVLVFRRYVDMVLVQAFRGDRGGQVLASHAHGRQLLPDRSSLNLGKLL